MTILLLIIISCILIIVGISYLITYFSYSEKEDDRVPVENYDLVKNPKTKTKTKKVTKLKTKK
jgi:hypothetical protein